MELCLLDLSIQVGVNGLCYFFLHLQEKNQFDCAVFVCCHKFAHFIQSRERVFYAARMFDQTCNLEIKC